MNKHIVTVDSVPAAGPYSQAVEAGPFVFCSGQIPVDPRTGAVMVTDIGAATEQVLKNLQAVLAAAGLGLEHVVKTTVYLADMKDFPAMNDVYARYFSRNFPARSTVQVAGLPKGAAIEIDAIALRSDKP
jgi:2-iminobutanoate/2-iminopropanoate deaminase